jgi:hypothetical protein
MISATFETLTGAGVAVTATWTSTCLVTSTGTTTVSLITCGVAAGPQAVAKSPIRTASVRPNHHLGNACLCMDVSS